MREKENLVWQCDNTVGICRGYHTLLKIYFVQSGSWKMSDTYAAPELDRAAHVRTWFCSISGHSCFKASSRKSEAVLIACIWKLHFKYWNVAGSIQCTCTCTVVSNNCLKLGFFIAAWHSAVQPFEGVHNQYTNLCCASTHSESHVTLQNYVLRSASPLLQFRVNSHCQ